VLTIFTIPKPFEGHIDVIQRNALESWCRLDAQVEVILCGDDPGVAEAAQDLGMKHLGVLPCTDYGTPLLDEAFRQVLALARHDRLAYINADIVLMRDFAEAVRRVAMQQYVLLGRRWLLDVEAPLAFNKGWEDALRHRVDAEGTLDVVHSLDYFVMPRSVLEALVSVMPPFAVGRPWWDTWVLFQARRRGIPVIDATASVRAVHQNHDYGHVPEQRAKKWHGPEGDRNRALAGGDALPRMGATDATHVLIGAGVEPAVENAYLHCRLKRWPLLRAANEQPTHSWFRVEQRFAQLAFNAGRRRLLPGIPWRRWIDHVTC